jgi:hypothetical protein
VLLVFIVLTHWVGCLWRKLNEFEGESSWAHLADSGGSSQYDADYGALSYTSVVYYGGILILVGCRNGAVVVVIVMVMVILMVCTRVAHLLQQGQQTLPRTEAESFFIIVTMVFGACLNAVVFGQVAMILNNFSRSSNRRAHPSQNTRRYAHHTPRD